MAREPSLAELEHEARHTTSRVALYQQKLYSGRGDTRRLAELQREEAGAAERLARARERAPGPAPASDVRD
ncbi:MAG TPA: hypothetical protein VNT03_06790 [Baekduia sp.]|nr:hypothetical protein [Baekduia sp.]